MECRKFVVVKEILSTEEGWEEHETIPVGTTCEAHYWNGSDVIEYQGKKICDVDSEMAKDYFKEIAQITE